jgi:hypothetical protein
MNTQWGGKCLATCLIIKHAKQISVEFGSVSNNFDPHRSSVTRPTNREAQIGIYSFPKKNKRMFRNTEVGI